MITKTDVIVALQSHRGAASGITAKALAGELNTNARQVRHIVTELRLDGLGICGHPKTGYFIAENPAEIEDTCKFLRSRAMHSLTLESKLRHIPLPDLLGQLKLPT